MRFFSTATREHSQDPKVDLQKWRLNVTGMVSNELTLTFDEISKMPKTSEANNPGVFRKQPFIAGGQGLW